MDLFVELKAEYRRNPYTCRRKILNIEDIFKKKLVENKEIKCTICGEPLFKDFRIACRIYDNKNVRLHPVHKACIEEHTSFKNIILSNSKYKDISDNDLIACLRIVQIFNDMDKSGQITDFKESKSTCSFNDMPNPYIKGEPFYTMVKIKKGELSGNIETYKLENKLLPVIYVSEKIAEKSRAVRDSSFINDYSVAGVSRSQLEGMLTKFNEKFVVVMGFKDEKAVAIPLTSDEIVEALKPNEWLSKVIDKSK